MCNLRCQQADVRPGQVPLPSSHMATSARCPLPLCLFLLSEGHQSSRIKALPQGRHHRVSPLSCPAQRLGRGRAIRVWHERCGGAVTAVLSWNGSASPWGMSMIRGQRKDSELWGQIHAFKSRPPHFLGVFLATLRPAVSASIKWEFQHLPG